MEFGYLGGSNHILIESEMIWFTLISYTWLSPIHSQLPPPRFRGSVKTQWAQGRQERRCNFTCWCHCWRVFLKIVSFIYFLMLDYVILVCNVSAVHKQVIIFQRLHGNIDFRIRELTNLSQVLQRASNKQCYLPFSFSWISLWTDISERPFHAEGFCKPISSHLFSWKSEI